MRQAARTARNAAVIALSLFITSGCTLLDAFSAQREEAEKTPQIRTVRTETVAVRQIEEPIHITADVESSIRFDIEPKLSGSVETLYKKLGDTVEEGDPIAKLSSEEADLAYEQAMAAVDQAKIAIQTARQEQSVSRQELSAEIRKMELRLNEMQRQHNKLRNDYDSGLVSKADVDRSASELETYRHDLELARKRLQSLSRPDRMAELENRLADAETALELRREALEQLTIKAPVGGVITQLSLIEGMMVRAAVSVGRIEQVDPVRIVAYLNEEGAKYVRGKTALKYVLPGGEGQGQAPVSYLSSIPDPERNAYVLELTVPNGDGRLKPGMKVSVELSEDAELSALAVPQYSVREEGSRRYVFVVEDGIARKREVKTGRTTPSYYEVLSGVQEGESIAITGINALADGERVIVERSGKEENAE
jgi:multidrug efflux pump subunit AcrA (membrane-fusion protein)